MSTIHTVTVETAKEIGLLPEEFEKIKEENPDKSKFKF